MISVKDLKDCFVVLYRVTKNQVSKLRENLRGYAKSLIPASITEITAALDILEKACGDRMQVVTHRVTNLFKVGPWPTEGSKDCYSMQIKWVVNVQTLLQEIIDLANTDTVLAGIIYNKEKVAQILKIFPPFIVDKLAKLSGFDEAMCKQIIL